LSLGITLKTMGYVLILLGAALLYFRRRNKFNRRNVAGVEEFKSFEHSVANRVLEMAMKIVAYLLIILGLIIVFKNKSKSGSISTRTEIQFSKKYF
jgi:uncharacterized membrane protein